MLATRRRRRREGCVRHGGDWSCLAALKLSETRRESREDAGFVGKGELGEGVGGGMSWWTDSRPSIRRDLRTVDCVTVRNLASCTASKKRAEGERGREMKLKGEFEARLVKTRRA